MMIFLAYPSRLDIRVVKTKMPADFITESAVFFSFCDICYTFCCSATPHRRRWTIRFASVAAATSLNTHQIFIDSLGCRAACAHGKDYCSSTCNCISTGIYALSGCKSGCFICYDSAPLLCIKALCG